MSQRAGCIVRLAPITMCLFEFGFSGRFPRPAISNSRHNRLRPHLSARWVGGAAFLAAAIALAAGLAQANAQQVYPTPYLFTTLAGVSSIGSQDGTKGMARVDSPNGLASDSAGNVYLADSGNHTIRKIAVDGTVTTVAGDPGIPGSSDGKGKDAHFAIPLGVAVAPDGTIYVADTGNHTIRKIDPIGNVTTVAGTAGSSGSTDGSASAARFNMPSSLALNASGFLYIADTGNLVVRQISPTGAVTTFAGTFGIVGSADGAGSAAQFAGPVGIAIDASGTLFVADSGNHVIRKITPAGLVSTLAGQAGLNILQKYSPPGSLPDPDGLADDARFDFPTGVAVDTFGNVIVADNTTSYFLRRVTPGGLVTTIGLSSYLDLSGHSSGDRLQSPAGVTVRPDGTLVVADRGNNCLRAVSPAGVVSTLGGMPLHESVGTADGTGAAARFSYTQGPIQYLDQVGLGPIALAPSGNLYLADAVNSTIRQVTPDGVVTTVAGQARLFGTVDGIGVAAQFSRITALTADGTGNVYIGDQGAIRRLAPDGTVTILAGVVTESGQTDGAGAAARFHHLFCLACDSAGNIYAADGDPDLVSFTPISIRKISPQGVVTTLSAQATADTRAMAVDRAGNLYFTSQNAIVRVSLSGDRTILAGVEGDFIGNEPNLGADGSGATARFRYPEGLTTDADGNVYVADTGDCTIRKITPAGDVTTLAGALPNPQLFSDSFIDGLGRAAHFFFPAGIAIDAQHRLYVTDGTTVRVGLPSGPPAIATPPQSLTVAAGGNAQFAVTASAVPDPTYQWQLNGTAITGATGRTFMISAARATDAGSYSVVVSNELGSVTSNQAMLTVNAATAPASPASSTSGGGELPAWFSLGLLALTIVKVGRDGRARRERESSPFAKGI